MIAGRHVDDETAPLNSVATPGFGKTVAIGFIRGGFFVLFGVIALFAVAVGVNIDGHADPATQCMRNSDVPKIGGPYFESTIVTGTRTFFPLGISCSYDSPDDTVGPQNVWHAQWLPTGVALVFGAASIGSLLPLPRRGATSARA
jgi:hypothetical protein